MKLMQHKASHLALAVGMALAACGGNDGSSPQPGANSNAKDSTATTAATTNATKAPDTPPVSENAIRGDVLIQALLTPTNTRDESGRVVLSRLEPENTSRSSPNGGGTQRLASPWMVVSNQITADPAAGLGANVLEFSGKPGATKGLDTNETAFVESVSAKLGVSAPGVAMNGNALAALNGGPLQIGQQVKLRIEPNLRYTYHLPESSTPVEVTLSSSGPFSIAQDAVIDSRGTSLHEWQLTESGRNYEASLRVRKLDNNPNQFSVCLNFGQYFGESSTICNAWEVPNGWTAGQPLKFLHQRYQDIYHSEHLGAFTTHTWSTKTGPGTVLENDLNKTSVPLNDTGISGALLAAMFDAWTPRAQGMQAIPPFASAATAEISPTAGSRQPTRISLLLESRATQYQDGAATSAYSPATGNYLHALQIGTYNGPNAARVPTAEFAQMTLALHVANNPGQGFTLPRWTGADIRTADNNGAQRWLVQSEQLSEGKSQKTILPDDLIPFGSAVQLWREPAPGTNNDQTHVMLTVEQSQPDDRSVDLCWSYASDTYNVPRTKVCSLWNISEGWQPGQPLRAEGYYVASAPGSGALTQFWNTFVRAN